MQRFDPAVHTNPIREVAFYLVLLGVLILLMGCSEGERADTNTEYYTIDEGYDDQAPQTVDYEDGVYCAEIEYYYSRTGTRASYTLKVDIEDGRLTSIHWPNCGWLDESHFSPPDISDGTAHFRSDRGIDYSVRILGDANNCSPDRYVTDEEELIRGSAESQEGASDRTEDTEENIEWIDRNETDEEEE